MIFDLLSTFIVYTFTLLFFSSYLEVKVLNGFIWLKIVFLAVIAWFIFFIFTKIKKDASPNH